MGMQTESQGVAMRYSWTVILSCLSLLPFFDINASWAQESSPKTLQGPAFSYSDKSVPKSEAWRKQPIRYQAKDVGLHIAMMLDQHIYPAVLPQIQDYAKEKRLKIVVGEGTCGLAEGMLRHKKVDIGGFCCPPSVQDRLPGIEFHTLGISPLIIMAHPDNPIDNLTEDQVRDIFQGKVRHWSQFATNKDRNHKKASTIKASMIKAITRLHCKLRPGHWRLILDNEELFGPRVEEVSTIMDVISRVTKHRNAIGYEEIHAIMNLNAGNKEVKILKINGADPFDKAALASGRYPFYRVHNITTWTTPHTVNAKAQQLVNYLLTNSHRLATEFHILPASLLPAYGWKFKGHELIGEP